MESELTGAKAYRGGQVSAARGPVKDEYPSVELRSMNAVQEGPEGLTSIIFERRAYHFDRVAAAFERLTNALETAERDGFGFVLVNHAPIASTRGMDVAAPPSQPVPRTSQYSLDSYFQSPL